jgi:hypothetical protein
VIRALCCVVLACAAAPAWADEAPPWAAGVSDAQQAEANALFTDGNQLFAQLAHAPALEKYKGAIAIWDHPMIRFNMAVTLVRLDRMLEAADELEKALRFGATPFTSELYQQALDYQNLVSRQLGHIEVRCDLAGAQILLDGKPWFVGPGTKKVRVTGGEHVVVAEHKGYLTVSRQLVVAGGSTVSEALSPAPLDTAFVVEYPHPPWMPWTVTGVGAATALSGLGMWLYGRNQLDDFEQTFLSECPTGCETGLGQHPELADMQDRALFKGKVGVTMMIAGGAVAAGGVVWWYLNRPMRRLPKLEVAPARSGGAASLSWSF